MAKKIALIICICFGFNLASFSQDSISLESDLNEERKLQFQEYFFKALSDKAIRNYQKAIGHLEMCSEILPDNPVVFFELSKNYFFLDQNQLARDYVLKAIEKEPENIWMQLHLVKILKKERNFKGAIKVQKKLVDSDARRKEELVYLYLQDRDYKNAVALMDKIQLEKGLSKNLMLLKSSLEARKSDLLQKKESNDLTDFVDQFNKNNSLDTLIAILKKSELEDQNTFQEYSAKGLNLFPAQPLVYLYRAKALFQTKRHKEALTVLQTGIDFIIDNNSMIKLFYEEMASNYKALGQNDRYLEMKSKAKQIKV